MNDSISENIKVFCRKRPCIPNEAIQESAVDLDTASGTCKYEGVGCKNGMKFSFDGAMDNCTQESVYETVAKPIVERALAGYSGTILAYGPTNSGKTHTMRGMDQDAGIIPRCMEQILKTVSSQPVDTTTVFVSYLQIYCEMITDLLSAGPIVDPNGVMSDDLPAAGVAPVRLPETQNLSIREREGKVFVQGLSRSEVRNMADFMRLLSEGDRNRTTAATNMNETSSRSHCALLVTLCNHKDSIAVASSNNNTKTSQKNLSTESTLVLVDLAGSERAIASAGRQYMRSEEAKAINLSISALGNCMSALSDRRPHIPYRDSKLTRLLQGSLGGGALTAILIAIPPGPDETGEVLNTLRFASRAAKVQVVAKVSRYVDFEKMYNETQILLDEQQQKEYVAVQQMKLERDQLRQEHQTEVAALMEELQIWKMAGASATIKGDDLSRTPRTPRTLSEGVEEGQGPIDSSDPAKDWDLKRVELVELHQQADILTKHHYDTKISKLEKIVTQLTTEVSELHDDVQKERLNHYSTLQDLKSTREKKLLADQSYDARLADCLADIQEKKQQLDDLHQKHVDEVASLTTELQQCQGDMSTMVTKEKVAEMELLFADAMSRLSTRVMQIEQKNRKEAALGSMDDDCDETTSKVSAARQGNRVDQQQSSAAYGRGRGADGLGSGLGSLLANVQTPSQGTVDHGIGPRKMMIEPGRVRVNQVSTRGLVQSGSQGKLVKNSLYR